MGKKGFCWNKGLKCPQISKALKGRRFTEEHRKKLKEASLKPEKIQISINNLPKDWHPKGKLNGMYGKHHAEEAKKRMGEKISKINKGRKKPSLIGNQFWKLRKKHISGMKDRHHTEESRKKLSESHKGKIPVCSYKWMKNPELSPSWKGGKQKIVCQCCKKIFYDWKSQNPKYCSIKCSKNSEIRRSKIAWSKFGANNSAWMGGKSYIQYPKEFFLIRDLILQRDNYICQNCKKSGNFVHHINHDKHDNSLDNLMVLCRGCNNAL